MTAIVWAIVVPGLGAAMFPLHDLFAWLERHDAQKHAND